MSADNGISLNGKLDGGQEFNLKEFFQRYIRYLPWLILSIVLCIVIAFVKLRYEVPIYSVFGKMLMKNQASISSNSENRFADLFGGQNSQNLNDEIEQLKSTSISKRVVNKLNLQTTYYNEGNIRSTLLRNTETPLRLEPVQLLDSSGSYGFRLVHLNNSQYRFKDSTKTHYYGETIEQNGSKFRFVLTGKPFDNLASDEFTIVRQSPIGVAKNIAATLNVIQSNDFSSVLILRYEIENPKVGIDIIDAFMQAYQEFNLEEKKEIAINTVKFIDRQLDTFQQELGGVERNLQQYRETNQAIDVTQQSALYFGNVNETQRQILGLEVQQKVADMLINYVDKTKDPLKIDPSALGISEPSLLQTISSYNQLQLQREVNLRTTPVGNPLIKDIDVSLAQLRSDLLGNLNNVRRGYDVALNDLQRKSKSTESIIGTIPGKEKALLEITRQQRILQELYSFLLQKKLETSIASAASISTSSILEPADYSSVPVRPNKKGIYLMAIIIGLAVPLSIITFREFLNDKIRKRSDVENFTATPILGEIGHSEGKTALIVTSSNRSYIAEQFRIIRSNLQYLIPKKQVAAKSGPLTVAPPTTHETPVITPPQRSTTPVIMVTSSFSGEGKSFVSTNLAAVLALSGRKTVILELDIRKPKILRGFGMNDVSGFTNFIVGNQTVDQLAIPVKNSNPDPRKENDQFVQNLFVIPCGPLPPNPSELLLDEKVQELFSYLKDHFEAIVIDTAPVGLVGDALTLGAYADTCVYIVRHNYTYKKQIKLIDELHTTQKLPKMAIVINDIKGGNTYGSYSGYGYGYGSSYGYGSGYFDDDKKKKRRKKE